LALFVSVAIVGVDFRIAAGRTDGPFDIVLRQSHTVQLRYAKAEYVARQVSEALPAGANVRFDAADNSITLLGSPLELLSLSQQVELIDETWKPSRPFRVHVAKLKGPNARRALSRAIEAARDANRRALQGPQ